MKRLFVFAFWLLPISLSAQSSPTVFIDAQITEAGKLLQMANGQSLFAVTSDKAQADFVLTIISTDLRNESKNLLIYSWSLTDNSRRSVIARGEELTPPDCLSKVASAVRTGWQIKLQLGLERPPVGGGTGTLSERGLPGSGSGAGMGTGSGAGIGPYVVGKDVTAPVPIYRPSPSYTQEARDARIEGIVVLQVIIRRDGSVDAFKVIKGLGYGLDEISINTIKSKWKFEPGTFKGVPVDVQANIEVTFKLK